MALDGELDVLHVPVMHTRKPLEKRLQDLLVVLLKAVKHFPELLGAFRERVLHLGNFDGGSDSSLLSANSNPQTHPMIRPE